MKIALITGGQPRFTPDFPKMMSSIQGFDSADIYMALWNTDWARTAEQARQKIEKILPENYKLEEVSIVEEPECDYPTHSVTIEPPREQNVAWWYIRQYRQWASLALAHQLVKKDYDLLIRFRLDGSPDSIINLKELDLSFNGIILPKGPLSGIEGNRSNDQFAIGGKDAMSLYLNLEREFKELVELSDPNWANDGVNLDLSGGVWRWGNEQLLCALIRKYQIPIKYGDFTMSINSFGRSRYTDKHYHHRVVSDPTEK